MKANRYNKKIPISEKDILFSVEGYDINFAVFKKKDNYVLTFFCEIKIDINTEAVYTFTSLEANEKSALYSIFSNNPIFMIYDEDKNINLEVGLFKGQDVQVFFELTDFEFELYDHGPYINYVIEIEKTDPHYEDFCSLINIIRKNRLKGEMMSNDDQSNSIEYKRKSRL